jgi:hypothetical protein
MKELCAWWLRVYKYLTKHSSWKLKFENCPWNSHKYQCICSRRKYLRKYWNLKMSTTRPWMPYLRPLCDVHRSLCTKPLCLIRFHEHSIYVIRPSVCLSHILVNPTTFIFQGYSFCFYCIFRQFWWDDEEKRSISTLNNDRQLERATFSRYLIDFVIDYISSLLIYSMFWAIPHPSSKKDVTYLGTCLGRSDNRAINL